MFCGLSILYVARFKGTIMNTFGPDRKNATIIAFDKPVSNRFSPNIRTENMIPFHPLRLTMKYRFEKFVVKCLCLKRFERLLLSSCLHCSSRKFLKGVFEKFQFKVAMCFQSLEINELIHFFMVDFRRSSFF